MRFRHYILAIVLILAGLAMAAGIELPPGWDTPMGLKGDAYDAARRIFPGASRNREDQLLLARDKALRMPGTSKKRADLPAGTVLSAPGFPLSVRSQGKKYMVLLWEGVRPEDSEDGGFGSEVAVLAVFPEGSIEPTDVAEVKQDRFTSLGQLVSLGDEDAFVVSSTHSNSGQGYALTDLFHLRDGRLRRIAGSIFTLSNNAGCSKSFEETLRWRTEPDGSNPPRIVATVDLIHSPGDFTKDCRPRPKAITETFENNYRWDAAKAMYRDAGGSLDRLYKWNERNL